MGTTSTLTVKGQTTVPKRIRAYLGLHAGDRLDFVVEEGRVILQPATVDVRELKGLLRRPEVPAVSVEEMSAAVRKRASKGVR